MQEEKDEQNLRELWGHHKRSNICVTSVSEDEKKHLRTENNPTKIMSEIYICHKLYQFKRFMDLSKSQ